jgi:prepilin-type N-terminal cleavage/methylation domain-containing protein
MNTGLHSDRAMPGFTLVELLVALVILASLVTVASVSLESTQLKARADKTSRIGRQVIADLERSDGPGFVSDFGRLPASADELKFLFSQTVTDSLLVDRTAAAYQLQNLDLPPDSSLPPGDYSKIEVAFGSPVLGIGWRGPYSLSTELRRKAGQASEFLDGWTNHWSVVVDTGALSSLRSLGRDGIPGGQDWQDEDLEFPLRRNLVTDNIDLQGQVLVRAADGTEYTSQAQFSTFAIKVIYFTPAFDANFAANPASGNIASVAFTWEQAGQTWSGNPARPERMTGNPFLFLLSGLTAGHRAFFVYAVGTLSGEPQPRLYGGGVRLVQIQPGTNRIEYTLTELN